MCTAHVDASSGRVVPDPHRWHSARGWRGAAKPDRACRQFLRRARRSPDICREQRRL